MKVRIKFSKKSDLRFIGHLDLMRFFQKAIRRSGLPIRFSEGMSPHMIMSFASPLGLGLTSDAEYVDLELTQTISSAQIVSRLNGSMVDGLRILDAVKIPEGRAQNAMALVSAAAYTVSFRDGCAPDCDWTEKLAAFLARETIEVCKETKKGQKTVDIRPMIYECCATDSGCELYMKLSAGSTANLKPELVMDAFADYAGFTIAPYSLKVNRCEMYADGPTTGGLVPLGDLGIHEPESDS